MGIKPERIPIFTATATINSVADHLETEDPHNDLYANVDGRGQPNSCQVIDFGKAQKQCKTGEILSKLNELLWTDPEAYVQLRDMYALKSNPFDERVKKKLLNIGIIEKDPFNDDGLMFAPFVNDALYVHVTDEEPFWW